MALRLLHTSDWHLGRTFHEASLLDDQEWVLERLIAALRDTRPDALVVAGDLYDRAVPPAEAVALLDEILIRVADLGIPVVAIAGNHDSPGAALLRRPPARRRAASTCAAALDRVAEPVVIPGKGLIYAVPFVDPDVVRGLARTRRCAATPPPPPACSRRSGPTPRGATSPPCWWATPSSRGRKRRPTASGPSRSAAPAPSRPTALAGFDYVALGHLHAPQEVAPRVRYSGSLLKYSFAEAGHRKAALLVEVERRGGAGRGGAARAAARPGPPARPDGRPPLPPGPGAPPRRPPGDHAGGRGLRLRRHAPAAAALPARPERGPPGAHRRRRGDLLGPGGRCGRRRPHALPGLRRGGGRRPARRRRRWPCFSSALDAVARKERAS